MDDINDVQTDSQAAPAHDPAAGSGGSRRNDRTDMLLTITAWVLAGAVVSAIGFLGWSVWSGNRAQQTSTPALRALDQLKRQVKAAPGNAAARVRLGEALATAGLTEDAIAQFKRALEIDSKHTGAYLDLGLIAMSRKDPSAAVGYFQKVVDLTGSSDYEDINQRRETALYQLGSIALDQRRYDDAARFFKGALRIRKDASDTYLGLAMALKGLGDTGAAIDNLNIALQFDPKYAQALYERALLEKQTGKLAEAAEDLAKARDLRPDVDMPAQELSAFGDAKTRLKTARSEQAAGKYAEALTDARIAVALDPTSVPALVLAASLYERQGDKKTALAQWQAAAKLAPKNAEVKAALARLAPKGKTP
jgi:tetratricopeptide (TPR) repeat protein